MRFSNTKSSRAKLLRVCDVVRTRMGMGSLPYQYHFQPWRYKGASGLAGCRISYQGWDVDITFYDAFFHPQYSLDSQLHTVVHEHIHASMIPTLQVMNRLLRADKKQTYEECGMLGSEITTDHLVMPWLHYMRPEINKVMR